MPPLGPRPRAQPKRRRPRRPSATQRARAQEQQYASQGRAVEHQANRQERQARQRTERPVHAAPVMRSPFVNDRTVTPIDQQQREQRQRVRRAARKLPAERDVRRFPTLDRYTPRQARTVVTAQQHALQRNRDRTGRSNAEIYAEADAAARQSIRLARDLGSALQTDRKRRGVIPRPSQLRAATHAQDRKLAGIPIESAVEALGERAFPEDKPGLRLIGAPFQLARATAEDPAAVAKSSVRTAVESIAGLPQAAKMIVDDPGSALDMIAKDYEKRYGPLVAGNARAFREQVKKDYGLTPFAADIGGAAAVSGRAAGLAARSGAYGRAVQALRGASEKAPGGAVIRPVVRAAEEVRKTATNERPRLREFAGEGGVRPQRTSRNLYVAAGQRTLDARRRAAYRKELGRAGLEEGPGGRVAVRGGKGRAPEPQDIESGAVKRTRALRPGQGEVRPLGGLREVAPLRRMLGRVARDVGKGKSQTRVTLLTHRARALRAVDKAVNQLDPHELRALKYVVKYGLPGENLPAAERALVRKLAQIRRARDARGFRGTTPALRDVADDVRQLRMILRDPAAHLTPRVRAIADEVLKIQRREEAVDPDLTPERALIRKDRPQAALLGVQRGPDVPFFEGVLDSVEHAMRGRGGEQDALSLLPQGVTLRQFGRLAREMPDQRAATAGELEQQIGKDRRAAERAVTTSQRRAAVVRAVLREREQHGAPITTDLIRESRGRLATVTRAARRLRSERDRLTGELRSLNREAQRVHGVKYGPDVRRTEIQRRLTAVREQLAGGEQQVKQLRQEVRRAESRAPRQTETLQKRLAHWERTLTLHRQSRDAARQLHALSRIVTRESKAKSNMRLESGGEFDAKLRDAAEAEGLGEPGYWMSSPRPRDEPSLAAIGTGGRAVAKSKRYTGALDKLGIEETGPDALRRGVERNIKRRLSWALVSRNMDVHAFEWSRGHHGEGRTAGELLREMDDRAIDPSTVAIIRPRIARRRLLDEAGMERGRVVDAAEVTDLSDDQAIGELHTDLKAARRTVEDLQNDEAQGQALSRYLVVPREVADELESATRPEGAFARSWHILMNEKPARILLGTLNVPWLAFQVASNAFLTGLGGGLNPLDIYGAHKWWRGLSEGEKEAVEVELGITHGHHFNLDQTKLGSTKDKMPGARHMVNFWQAYKKSRVGRVAHRANPLDAMFKADEAQNNFFRKVLFYNQAKKSAYGRLGKTWRSMDRLKGKLASVLALPPERMGAQIAKHGPEFEQHAQHVRDFLGDYLRFSDQERKLLSRNVMFYGYLRFSLRFAFYTMPIQHPIMTAILSELGRMGSQEVKSLFGVPPDYRLPTSMLASTYFGDRHDAKKGNLRQIPFGRFNPFLNAVTQLQSEQQLAGLVSPLFQEAVDQMFEESSFTGQDWRIKGIPTPSEAERPKDYYGSIFGAAIPGRPRNRILTRDLLGLAFPYRAAEKVGIPEVRLPGIGKVPGTGVPPLEGPQGDDTLLWSPRPTEYKDPSTVKSIKRSIRQQRREQPGAFAQQAIPMLHPQRTRAPQVIERELEKEEAARSRLKSKGHKRKHKKSRRYGGGTDYGARYGGASSSTGAGRYGG